MFGNNDGVAVHCWPKNNLVIDSNTFNVILRKEQANEIITIDPNNEKFFQVLDLVF